MREGCHPGRNTLRTLAVLVLALLSAAPFSPAPCRGAEAGDEVGTVRTLKGDAHVVRDGRNITADKGFRLMQDDTVVTGEESSLGLVLKDSTRISIGPSTVIRISEFAFSPSEKKFSLVTRMFKGTAAYVSGIIGNLAPAAVRFDTPKASLGIRGTRFLVNKAIPRGSSCFPLVERSASCEHRWQTHRSNANHR